MKNDIKVFWIDLFAGAGGTSTGIHMASANAEVLACVNHDANAIKSHALNHPNTIHFTEDIRDPQVARAIGDLVAMKRKEFPNCVVNLWASLECTNYSRAKGGMPRDADSRTLANHLFMYLEFIKPEALYIENVVEFMCWGPLETREDKSLSIKGVSSGLKLMFDKKSNTEVPSYFPKSKKNGVDYLRWVEAIKSVGYPNHDHRELNAADFEGYSSRNRYFGIFTKKDLPISWPKPTHSEKPESEDNLFGNKREKWLSVRDVLDLTDHGKSIFGLNANGKFYSQKTLARVFAGLKKQKLGQVFMTSYYGNGGAHSVDAPCNTLTTKDRFALHFINYDYSSPTHGSIEKPVGTVTTIPKHNLCTIQWTFDTQFSGIGRSIDRPGQSLIASMHKKPVYLASATRSSDVDQRIDQPNDSDLVREMRAFMREHGVVDVKIRGLKIKELLKIQGFPEDYKFVGTVTDVKKFIGNAVHTAVSKKLAEAHYDGIVEWHKKNERIAA